MVLTSEQQELIDKYATPIDNPNTIKKLTPEQQELIDKYATLIPISSASEMHRQLSQSLQSPHERELHDITAGLVNPWINMANLIPHVNISRMHRYNPNSKTSFMADVAGNVLPFLTGEGAIATGASKIPEIAEGLKLAPSVISRMGHLSSSLMRPSSLRTAIVSGGLSAATAKEGQRGVEGALGALSGGALHGLGYLAGQGMHSLKTTPIIKKAVKAFQPPITALLPEDSAKTASNEIAASYAKALNNSDDLYANATVAADLKGIKFSKNDLPNYNRVYGEQLRDKKLPDRGVKSPSEMLEPLSNPYEISKLILPEELQKELQEAMHENTLKPTTIQNERSKLLKMGRGAQIGKEEYNDLAHALKLDYLKKMDAEDPRLGDAYIKANDFYRDTIKNKFHAHKAFKKMKNALTVMPGYSEDVNDLYKLNWHGESPQSLINNLVPSSRNQGMEQLEDFQNDLMGGDKEKTAQLAKDLMFSKYTTPLNGEPTPEEIETPNYKFNMYKFLTHYNALGNKQKDYLFNKEERDILNKFASHRDKLKKPGLIKTGMKKLGAGLLSYLTASHSGMGTPGSLAGAAAGALLARPVESAADSAAQAILPSELKKLIPKLNPYQASFNTTRLPAIAGITAIQRLRRDQNA